MSRTVQITFDCHDPNALAGFWNEALGYRYDSPPPGFATWEEALDHFGVPEEDRNNASASVDPDGAGPRLWFQKVPEVSLPELRARSQPSLDSQCSDTGRRIGTKSGLSGH